VKTRKLSTVDGFVLLDLENAPGAVGVVRSAPKILVGGAEMLARSVTYSFAAFGVRAGGASAGVNAKPEDRSAAVAAFAAEVAGFDPPVLIDAAKGIDPADLAALTAKDPRRPELRAVTDGVSGADDLLAAGVLAAAEAAGGPLSGKRAVIEGFGPTGIALARRLAEAGATVVAVATTAGTALEPGGFDPMALAEAWAAQGDAMAKSIGSSQKPAWAAWGADADIVFCGSKAGAMTHEGAALLKARTVVPIAPVPVTAKALAVMGRAGVTYVPDFVAIAAPLLAGSADVDPADCPARIAELVRDLAGSPDGLFLAACARAEAFLRSWQDALPFGRPLA
jgi:glutamate dehydrogenase (NAD(P)+)